MISKTTSNNSWFDDFLADFAKQVELNKSAQLNNKMKELQKVESVVAQYREAAGLSIISNASKEFVPIISKRAAAIKFSISVIKQNSDLMKELEEFAKNSGGTKDNISLINHIREKLNNSSIAFDDPEINKLLNEMKAKYKKHEQDCDIEMGSVVRTDNDQQTADYAKYTGKKTE